MSRLGIFISHENLMVTLSFSVTGFSTILPETGEFDGMSLYSKFINGTSLFRDSTVNDVSCCYFSFSFSILV